MNRQEKEQIIKQLKHELSSNDASFVVRYQGLTVAELSTLRKQLRKKESSMVVAKVTLMKRAIEGDASLEGLQSLFADQVALVFAKQESPAVAKILSDFAKEHEALNLLGGYFESLILDQKAVKSLAALPSREILLARLCGALKGPVAKFACVLKAVAEKKSSESGDNDQTAGQ